MAVAVLGLGGMGSAIATRLLAAGHEVTVWNRSPGRAAALVRAGATEAGSTTEAVDGATAVLVSLVDDAAVRGVLLPGGEPLRTLATVANCTTGSPDCADELDRAFPGRFVAAPILGAPTAVTSGTATYLLGGQPAAVEALQAVLAALTSSTLVTGPAPASAAAAKLAINALLLSGLVALSEAVAATQAAGLSPEVVDRLFSSSALVAPGLKNRLPDVVSGAHDKGWFAMPLGAKDLNLFRALARSGGLTVPVADAAAEAYGQASTTGLRTLDVAGIVEHIRGYPPEA